ncbi:tetraspanin-1-like isoform X1 [Pomacea canaliculata]|uniref:tetraspanin-1-like isoform X1 n=2 Tax=Pomacea canaliculata TaxID=400727 RepID=UPI000D730EC2|nr:tetraspanin-1-like isoform X1 [Pomacea canaliculata]
MAERLLIIVICNMNACSSFAQCVLVIINTIFAVFGIVFLIVGCMVRFGSSLLDDRLQTLYAVVQEYFEKSGSTSSLSDFNIGDFLQSATLAFILIGVFFFIIGMLGCLGACCKIRWCLIVYLVILGIIIAGEVTFIILVYTIDGKIQETMRTPLYDSLRDDYKGINSSEAVSVGWNFAMVTFKCCGVTNYTDFEKASKWQRNYTVNGQTFHLQVPIACCKSNSSFPNVQLPDDFSCAVSPTTATANIDKGCYDALVDFILDHINILIAVGASVGAVEILMFIFAICVLCAAQKDDDVKDF